MIFSAVEKTVGREYDRRRKYSFARLRFNGTALSALSREGAFYAFPEIKRELD